MKEEPSPLTGIKRLSAFVILSVLGILATCFTPAGRFFTVVMRAPEAAEFEPVHQAYLAKYGSPRAVPATLEEDLIWSWPKAQLALSRDAADGGLTIRYADAAILAEVVR